MPCHDEAKSSHTGAMLASGELAAVSVCSCGVITVTLQALSLRFEPEAFRELQLLLAFAQRRIDRDRALLAGQAGSAGDTPPAH